MQYYLGSAKKKTEVGPATAHMLGRSTFTSTITETSPARRGDITLKSFKGTLRARIL